MKFKMTKEQEQLFEHLGEVAIVYDSAHKRLWSHPDVKGVMNGAEHEHVPGIRVWVSVGTDKGDYHGDYIFILRSFGPGPDNLYFDGENKPDKKITNEVLEIIYITIIEDVTVWGQAATEEPYQKVVNEITKAGMANKVWIRFSPDCGICEDDNGLGYST